MTDPRIVLTVLVRDEVDVIADMLEWHLHHGVDHVIAMDNASSDGTTDILEDLAATGSLTLVHQPSDAYLQDVWATEMAVMAREQQGADWVISSDADEFWMADASSNLKEALGGIESDVDFVTCSRINLMGSREDLAALPWPDSLVWRAEPEVVLPPERRSDPAPLDPPFIYYALAKKVILNPTRLTRIRRGAHLAEFDGEPTEGPDPKIHVHHVPFRDEAEFSSSTARIAGGVERDPTAAPNTSWKSRRWSRMPPDEAFAEALPDSLRLQRDVRDGRVVLDTRLRDVVTSTRGRQASRFALYGATNNAAPPERDALAPAVPLLVMGDDPVSIHSVVERLEGVGARRPPAPGGQDLQRRIAELHHARAAAPDDSTNVRALRAEIRRALETLGSGGHGAIISDPGAAENLDLWNDLSREGHLAPAVVLLVEHSWGHRLPADTSPSMIRAEEATRELPRLIVPPSRLLASSPASLHRALAALGLWLPLSVTHSESGHDDADRSSAR